MSPAAQWLEARFSRAEALRAITKRLNYQLYGPHPVTRPGQRVRLKNRLARAHAHLAHLTGGPK